MKVSYFYLRLCLCLYLYLLSKNPSNGLKPNVT
jgi:hypothetical protein